MKRVLLLCAVLVSGCAAPTEEGLTGLEVHVTYDVPVDQLRFSASVDGRELFSPESLPSTPSPLSTEGEDLVILVSPDEAGGTAEVSVTGYFEGGEVGAGRGPAVLVEGEVVRLDVVLTHGACSGDSCPCNQDGCRCEGGQECRFDSGDDSRLDCRGSASCQGACGDRCDLNCEFRSRCEYQVGRNTDLDCRGGNCTATVGEGSSVSCTLGADCDITCTGACTLNCSRFSDCRLTCNGEEATDVDDEASCP